jgi:hypothetical protein
VQFDGSLGFSELVPTTTLVFANIRFAEVSNSEDHADSIGRFDLLLVTQSTAIGYHFVCFEKRQKKNHSSCRMIIKGSKYVQYEKKKSVSFCRSNLKQSGKVTGHLSRALKEIKALEGGIASED